MMDPTIELVALIGIIATAIVVGVPPLVHPYVSKEGAAQLLRYQYSGSDASYWYKYVSSPLAEKIAERLPWWIAPNTITVSGLALIVVGHAVMVWHLPTLEGAGAPAWVHYYAGLSLLAYQILDCADGKQARRTGNGTPMGLLFDHGCDAINCAISGITLCAGLQLGLTWRAPAVIALGSFPFFAATWEEYYTGTLALPVINGANEGIVSIVLVHLVNGYGGEAMRLWWIAPCPFYPSMSNNTACVLGFGVTSVLTVAKHIGTVMGVVRERGGSLPAQGHALAGIVPYTAYWAAFFLWAHFSPEVIEEHGLLAMWALCFFACKLTMHIMLAHLCEQDTTMQLRKTFVPMGIVAFVVAAHRATGVGAQVSDSNMVKIWFAITAVTYWHMVVHVINEMCGILNIRCFTAKPPPGLKQE
jgi:ethanolaminephosphotransferase